VDNFKKFEVGLEEENGGSSVHSLGILCSRWKTCACARHPPCTALPCPALRARCVPCRMAAATCRLTRCSS
jgi:hypothetical protein